MDVVVLKTNLDEATSLQRNETFYFKDMEDCNRFLEVFEDHFCNVPWKTPEQKTINSIPPIEVQITMNMDPVKRAEKELSWGFNLCKTNNIGETPEQIAFVKDLINRIESRKS